MSEQLQIFFKKHHFQRFTISSLAERILNDMKKGLEEKNDNVLVYQPMIPVYGFLNEKEIKGKRVIVIDAGGTNFRSSVVHFSDEGIAEISDLLITQMPGADKEL